MKNKLKDFFIYFWILLIKHWRNRMSKKYKYLEIGIHILFWVFYFTTINVDWTSDWFDKSIRLKTPAPLLVLIFPFYFYMNAFFLIPKYFNLQKWMYYLAFGILIFIVPELLRSFFLSNSEIPFTKELFGRDSFLFGAPSPFFIALNISFIYCFAKDRFFNKAKTKESDHTILTKKETQPYENVSLLTETEIKELSHKLKEELKEEEAFLNPNLTLRELAESINTTEKKLSFLLNQEMETNFYEYINKFRVEKFKSEVGKAENENLSILGLAMNCGFKSKSSFYRTFKAEVGTSPSQFLKKMKKNK